MNWDMFGCFDSEANSISTDFQNGNLDVVGDYDLLVFLAANNEHYRSPRLKSGYILKEKYVEAKIQLFLQVNASIFDTFLSH